MYENSEMYCQEATVDYIESILTIEHDSFPPGIREDKKVFIERIETFSDGFLLLMQKNPLCCIGYISSEIWQIENDPAPKLFTLGHSIRETHIPGGNTIYISSTCLFQGNRRRGLGRFLFDSVMNNTRSKYQNITKALLIVGETWHAARRIYTTSGFQPLFTIGKFFKPDNQHHFNGIVMIKNELHDTTFAAKGNRDET